MTTVELLLDKALDRLAAELARVNSEIAEARKVKLEENNDD